MQPKAKGKVTVTSNYADSVSVKLFNRDIIMWGCHVFMVSTYGEKSQYCSLIDLKNGSRAFPEPCSRNTTISRIGSHLSHYKPWYPKKDFRIIPADQYELIVNVSCFPSELNTLEVACDED